MKKFSQATAPTELEYECVGFADEVDLEDRITTAHARSSTGSSNVITHSGTTSTLRDPTYVAAQSALIGIGFLTVVEDHGSTETVSVATETAILLETMILRRA